MIKLVVFDFDGVFTNGKISFIGDGQIVKHYNVKDGMGIQLLKKENIEVGVISGYRHNTSQESILSHLNINLICLNCHNKDKILEDWITDLNITWENVAFMGDDINDIPIINRVKFSGTPNNGHQQCKDLVDFISLYKGGEGCVRDFCDTILKKKFLNNESIEKQIKKEFLHQINNFNMDNIKELSNLIIKKSDSQTNNIFFSGIGKSENIANHCCNLLKSIGIRSFNLNWTNSIHGDMGSIKKDDLIILFSKSGNTSEIINSLNLVKKKGSEIYGICCHSNSKFNNYCDQTIVLPFREEINSCISFIPTNSYMSQLIFTNILVSYTANIKGLTIDKYQQNHPCGNIGKNLKSLEECFLKNYPIKKLNKRVRFTEILLEMTQFNCGCCLFTNESDELIGIILDGDIRRLILKNNSLQFLDIEDINTNYYFENDPKKKIFLLNKHLKYIPVIDSNKKIIGLSKIF